MVTQSGMQPGCNHSLRIVQYHHNGRRPSDVIEVCRLCAGIRRSTVDSIPHDHLGVIPISGTDRNGKTWGA